MGGRPKRRRAAGAEGAAEVERMVAELQAQLGAQPAARLPPRPHGLAAPLYDRAARALREEQDDLAGAAGVLCALRFSMALGIGDGEWLSCLRARLDECVRRLRLSDSDFALATSKYVAGNKHLLSESPRGAGALWRRLDSLGQIDILHVALWDLGRRRGQRLAHHPSGLAVSISRDMISTRPAVAEELRQLFLSVPKVASLWGVRSAWLKGRGGQPWQRGGCLLLRWMRARWCELACLLHGEPAVDAADEKVRRRLLAFSNIGRDLGAQHMAFAIPSPQAVHMLSRLASFPSLRHHPRAPREASEQLIGRGEAGGLVELGAYNGYWAALVRKQCVKSLTSSWAIDAIDIAPPSRSWNCKARVRFGGAEALRGHNARTLLLCMPSPGEQSLADDALTCFGGEYVAYVGEWGSGMTGTLSFQKALTRSFKLVERMELPNWPKARVELYLFQRKGDDESSGEQVMLTCDVCARGNLELWQCPWSRQYRVCGEACYERSEQAHHAVLASCFCAIRASARPPFALWDKCEWLDAPTLARRKGEASEKQWLALAAATPQPDA